MGMLRSGAVALAGVVGLGIVVTVGHARAADDDWRLGADMGFGGGFGGLGGIGSLGTLGVLDDGPSATAGLEYQLGPRWSLIARVGGAVTSNDESNGWLLRGAVGARYALNPEDRVRLSVSGVLDLVRAERQTDTSDETLDDWFQSGGATVGIAGDIELTRGLELRIALDLVRVAVTDFLLEGSETSTSDTTFSLTFDMEPSIGLAIVF